MERIEDLNLNPVAEQACRDLQAVFPEVVFTSGRRKLHEQTWQMANNAVRDESFLAATYKHGHQFASWWRGCPYVKSRDGLAALIFGAVSANPALLDSPHLKGDGADLQPMEDDRGMPTPTGAMVIDHIRRDPRTVKLLLREGNRHIWHWQIKASDAQS